MYSVTLMLISLMKIYLLKHLALAKYLIDFKLNRIRDYINTFPYQNCKENQYGS